MKIFIIEHNNVVVNLQDNVSGILNQTLLVKLNVEGVEFNIEVPKGFYSDFASSPRFLWGLIPPTQFPIASIVHDWLYTNSFLLSKNGFHFYIDRYMADNIYFSLLKHSGASNLYGLTCYYGVRLAGKAHWNGIN